ncbi:MAG: hypothetical protein ACLRSD_09620 [Oscillibacter sp.]
MGKLDSGSAWYFAANVNEEDAASLKENSRLTLRMASGVGFDLPVTLTRISAAENGKCLIVLKSTRHYILHDAAARAERRAHHQRIRRPARAEKRAARG